jgi:ornithine decarboxylase
MDPFSFVDAIKRAYSVFEMASEQGIQFTMLDIGGGWPGNEEHTPSFETIADTIRDLMNELFPSTVEIIAEPGRYFACASHTLVTNVFARREVIKHPDEKQSPEDPEVLYYINDGIYGSFNCIIFDHMHISICYLTQDEITVGNNHESESDDTKDSKLYKSVIFGPTCDSIDKLITGVELPKLNIGDWLYFHEFGAYTTAASSAFNGFKTMKQFFIWRN